MGGIDPNIRSVLPIWIKSEVRHAPPNKGGSLILTVEHVEQFAIIQNSQIAYKERNCWWKNNLRIFSTKW